MPERARLRAREQGVGARSSATPTSRTSRATPAMIRADSILQDRGDRSMGVGNRHGTITPAPSLGQGSGAAQLLSARRPGRRAGNRELLHLSHLDHFVVGRGAAGRHSNAFPWSLPGSPVAASTSLASANGHRSPWFLRKRIPARPIEGGWRPSSASSTRPAGGTRLYSSWRLRPGLGHRAGGRPIVATGTSASESHGHSSSGSGGRALVRSMGTTKREWAGSTGSGAPHLGRRSRWAHEPRFAASAPTSLHRIDKRRPGARGQSHRTPRR